jgi:hypothetical protein
MAKFPLGFRTGFMKSISSSYEVQVSDEYSNSTDESSSIEVDSITYSTDQEMIKTSTCGNRNIFAKESNGTSAYRSGSDTYEANDELTSLPTVQPNTTTNVQRTHLKDCLSCTATTGATVASSFSTFVNVVDSGVDVVVNKILPLDDEPSFTTEVPKPKIKQKEHAVVSKPKELKKTFSLTRRTVSTPTNRALTNQHQRNNKVQRRDSTSSSSVFNRFSPQDKNKQNDNESASSYSISSFGWPKSNNQNKVPASNASQASLFDRWNNKGQEVKEPKQKEPKRKSFRFRRNSKKEAKRQAEQAKEKKVVEESSVFDYFFKWGEPEIENNELMEKEDKKKGMFKFRKTKKEKKATKKRRNRRGYEASNE